MTRYLPAALLASILSGVACGPRIGSAELHDAPVGTEVIVERSADRRPDWIVNPPEEGGGMMYFSGGEEGQADYAHGMRMAKAEAWQDMGESILSIWSSLLQVSEVGDKQELEQYGRNFQELAVREIGLAGGETEERYYEKVAVRTEYGVQQRYNTFVLIKLPRHEYRAAQLRALRALRERTKREGNRDAERFIDEAIERLQQIQR